MRRLVSVALLPGALACASSYGGDVSTPVVDAGADEASAPDGGCDPSATWRPAQIMPDLYDPAGHRSPFLADGELTMYLASSEPGDLLKTTRAPGGLFGAPRPVDGVNLADRLEADPVLSPEGRWLYFTSRDAPSADNDLYRVPRDTPGAVRERLTVSSDAADQSPSFASDGTLYFASSRSGLLRIYRAASVGDAFGPAVEVAELSSPEDNDRPVISADGLTIYWRSLRTDLSPALGGEDIIVATRASTTALFGGLRRVSELSSAGREAPGWLSPDGCRMYLTRSPVADGSEPTQIYLAPH